MLAEWAEDENVWLPQSLISKCINHQLEFYKFEGNVKGNFFAGVDLGKHQDYSVVSIVEMKNDIRNLVHCHQFPLKTSYASVIGYVKTLCDRWRRIHKVLVDMTGVGDYIVEDMINAGIRETEGVKFTQQTKQEMATYLKQTMVQGKFALPYNNDLIAELNVERFELTKSGAIKFNHPQGTHDDRFWSAALAVYASRAGPGPEPAFIFV